MDRDKYADGRIRTPHAYGGIVVRNPLRTIEYCDPEFYPRSTKFKEIYERIEKARRLKNERIEYNKIKNKIKRVMAEMTTDQKAFVKNWMIYSMISVIVFMILGSFTSGAFSVFSFIIVSLSLIPTAIALGVTAASKFE